VAAKVTEGLQKEIASLREQLQEKDKQIESLQDAVDSLEQYSRRNCVRIGPIPESDTENVHTIVEKVASSAGVVLPEGAIDRAHRVGKKPTAYQTYSRSIIVKLTSYQHKAALMRSRKNLSTVDGAALFTDVTWPALESTNRTVHKIFINDDLTQTRSKVAVKARELKRDKRVDDTWVRDGAIHVKRGESKFVFTRMRDLDSFIAGL
jgi:cell division septum initiation protein DivIVA